MKILKFSGAKLTLADQVLVSGSGFVLGVLIGRLLGISALGVFTVGIMAWLFTQMSHSALITAPMMTLVPSLNEHEQKDAFNDLAWISLVSAIVLAMTAALALKLTDYIVPSWGIGDQWWLWSLAVFTGLCQEYVRKVAFTKLQPGLALGTDIIRFVGQTIAILTLAVMDMLTLESAIGCIAACGALGCALRPKWLVPVHSNRESMIRLAKRYWLFGRWLLWSSLIQWGATNVIFLVSGALIGTAAIGALRAATQLAQPIHVLMLALDNRVPVVASKQLKDGGIEVMHRYIVSIWKRGALPIALAAVGISLSAWHLMGFVYGLEFQAHSALVAWACLMASIRLVAGPTTAALRALDRTSSIFQANLANLFGAVIITYPVIVIWGVTGAAAGMTLASSAMTIILVLHYRKALFRQRKNGN